MTQRPPSQRSPAASPIDAAPVKQGEIHFVNLPYEKDAGDHVQARPRPCLVVSRSEVNGPVVVIVPLSKAVEKANSFRIKIPRQFINVEPGETFPFLDCVALCDHIRVVNRRDLQRCMGTLSQSAMYGVSAGLAFLFDY